MEALDAYFACSRPNCVIRYADQNSVQGILSYRKKCRVLGGLKIGRKPYVNFKGARYSNESLAQRFDLVGTFIWVINHLEDDARVAQASTLDGIQLGVLRAAPPWHKFPHSLKIRSAINSLVRERRMRILDDSDAVEAFLDFVESQPDKKLPCYSTYLDLRRIITQQAHTNASEMVLENALNNLEIDNKYASKSKSDELDSAGVALPAPRMAASD